MTVIDADESGSQAEAPKHGFFYVPSITSFATSNHHII